MKKIYFYSVNILQFKNFKKNYLRSQKLICLGIIMRKKEELYEKNH